MLKQRHGGMDRREDGPRPAQPKSSNTQLDECLRCQQLQGTGVDQDLAVTCKDKKKKILSVRACLHTIQLADTGTPHLARYYHLILTS